MITSNRLRRCRRPARLASLAACVAVVLLVRVDAGAQRRKPAQPIAPASASSQTAPDTGEVRALWVARTSLTSPAAIAKMIEEAEAARFNTLLVQIRGRGDAYYADAVEPRAAPLRGQPTAFDPLDATLRQAHEAGLRVHAWISVNLVSSAATLPDAQTHVIYQHPEWLMVPRAAARELAVINTSSPLYRDKLVRAIRRQSAEAEGLYLSPIDPGAIEYLASVVADIAGRYPIDGLHLDYVRYPSDDFDYSKNALAAFADETARDLPRDQVERLRGQERTNLFAWTDAFPERWSEFRRARLTALVERVRGVVKTRRPRALLSAAVVPDPDDASRHRMQDWRGWLDEGLLDVVCPMAYASEAATFATQMASARQAAGSRPMWVGIGAYRLSTAQTIDNILAARRAGVAGVILFSYDALAAPSAGGRLSRIGQAVFRQ